MKRQELTAEDICREEIINTLIDQWQSEYKSINKINDVDMNKCRIKNKKDYDDFLIKKAYADNGGELAALAFVKELQVSKLITNKMAFDIRKRIKKAFADGVSSTPNGLITELNNTISQTGEYLRETVL